MLFRSSILFLSDEHYPPGGPELAALDPVLHSPLPPAHRGQHLQLILHLLDEALQGKYAPGRLNKVL